MITPQTLEAFRKVEDGDLTKQDLKILIPLYEELEKAVKPFQHHNIIVEYNEHKYILVHSYIRSKLIDLKYFETFL